jgi:hypothetical protein
LIGLVISPVLIGYAPLGGDPELMYLPIKAEFARSISLGRLPFWSDHFGLGVPLVAESHVAAFYPFNWFIYRVLSVSLAYRLTMWLHTLALFLATFAYARVLGLNRPGGILAAITFTLCGFQAVHIVHEPFYHLIVYLPICLLLTHLYAQNGRFVWLAGLALTWALQVTLGHFQIQMWTAGLVILTGGWKVLTLPTTSMARKLGRLLGLAIALCWGIAIVWLQLSLTRELTGVSGFVRPPQFLSNFLFPPSHWAQFALPELFLGRPLGNGDLYWRHQGTTSGEACAYVGVAPFILAFIGWLGKRGDRALTPWKWIVPVSLALATMPGWWPDGFHLILQIPGLGWFRAPARYTLLTSFGLALLAGRGLDQSILAIRYRIGLGLSILIGITATVWSIQIAQDADFQAGLGVDTLRVRFALAALAWFSAIAAIMAWRHKHVGAWAPVLVTMIELLALYFNGPVWWRWQVQLPEASPVLARLSGLPDAGLIAGRLLNIPVMASTTTSYPNFGITPPPPNYLLEASISPPARNTDAERRWQRRFGVTHGVWCSRDEVGNLNTIDEIDDPALDEVMSSVPNLAASGLGPWKLVRYVDAFPSVRVVSNVREAANWGRLYSELSHSDSREDAWFLVEDNPPTLPPPVATIGHVKSWDGRTAVVEHNGSCILVMRRTYYPGWKARIDDGAPRPVRKVDGGLQGVCLSGASISRVTVTYEPTDLRRGVTISLVALTIALAVLVLAGLRAWQCKSL